VDRLWEPALAHAHSLRRPVGGAHAGRILQVRRPLERQDQGGGVGAWGGLAGGVPSNAEDAVGLLRRALRGNDPVIFFEHRAMLDGAWARRPYPGNEFVVPFGQARLLRAGTEVTVVSWGAMLERCELACARSQVDVELLDLRTLSPWDKA